MSNERDSLIDRYRRLTTWVKSWRGPPGHMGSPPSPVNGVLPDEEREEGYWVSPDDSVMGELSKGGEVAGHSGTCVASGVGVE